MVEIMTATYTVTAERGTGNVWALECADVGAVSQTKRLDQAADEMREAIAYQAGISPEDMEIRVEVILPTDIAELKLQADQQRAEAEAAQQASQASSRNLASAMKAIGFTVRDMGHILGVSYQRAAKLAAR